MEGIGAARTAERRGLDAVSLADVFDRSRYGMMLVNDDRRYVDVNAAACGLLGVGPEEVLGRRIDDLATPARRRALPEAWTEFLRTGRAAGTFDFVLPGGRTLQADFLSLANVGPNRHVSILHGARVIDPANPDRRRLSAREREVMQLLASGADGPQIAAELVLSPATVRTHINNAMRKLGANTRAHAVALALHHEGIEP